MAFVSTVALLALLEYMIITMLTGRARGAYKIEAPATTGHPIFERWLRVQQNSVEQLIVFLPALFLFARYASVRWAGWLGLLFVVGRAMYARSYVADPTTRGTGFAIGLGVNAIFVIGALLGAMF